MGILLVTNFGFCYSQTAEQETDYIKMNMQYTDFSILGIGENFYTHTLTVLNISGDTKRTIRSQVFQGEEFLDDGLGFDIKANDGILTSKRKYASTQKLFVAKGQYKMVSDIVIADSKYAYSKYQQDYNSKKPKIKVTVDCDFHSVPCCNCSSDCGACKLGWWPHSCVEFSNCHVTFTIDW